MNNLTKLSLSLLMIINVGWVQGQCLTEGITFTSQNQIDNFPLNYPDCTEIIGNVIIGGYLDNLDGLSQIAHIGGFLKINNTTLENLNGLDNLQSVESLLIESNNDLEDIEALGNLTSTNRVVIMLNSSILSLSGLEGITILPLELNVQQNMALESLNGLQNIASIGKNCHIYWNPQLQDLNGLEGLSEVGWSVNIGENDSLVSLQGLENLSSVGKNFTIIMNPELATVASLNSLNSVDGYFHIQNQSSLVSLDGLENLNSLNGSLNISVNNVLNNIDGIKNIAATTITDLQIFLNPNLSQCAVQSVCDFLDIDPSDANINTNGAGCDSVEQVQTACALDISDNQSTELKIYPNPTNNTFVISGLIDGKIEIIDSQGRSVKQMNIGEKEYSISELSSGVYFLKITSEDSSVTRRLVKL